MTMIHTLFYSMRSGVVAALTMMSALGLVGCGAISHSATDTNTNWLSACDEDAECGSELACLCGACTIACESDGQCEERDQSSQSSQCSSNAACGASAVCVSSEQSPPDDQTATPSSVSPSVAPSSVAPDELACGRPRSDYEYIGEGCPIDFDCWSFTDECGCGCLPAECQTGDRQYIATSPGVCLVATFDCLVQQTPFSDECGCGCQYSEVLAPECDLPDRRYLTIGPGSCAGIGFVGCEPGGAIFEDECGCGCQYTSDPECAQPDRQYMTIGPGSCAGANITCGTGEMTFEDECGCGCILPSAEPACDEAGRQALEDELRAEWANVAACTSDEQCEVQNNVMCGAQTATLEFVECSLPVNNEADQVRLREVEGALSACGVLAADCNCVPLPSAGCVNGACRALDEQTLCETTGGTWEPGSCGHYACGLSPACEALIPGCDCGPGANFKTSTGCVPDPACGVE